VNEMGRCLQTVSKKYLIQGGHGLYEHTIVAD
jgi:hypothetical protein